MAYGDLERSIRKASNLLGIDIPDSEMPTDYPGLVALDKSLWSRVNARKRAAVKHPESSRPSAREVMNNLDWLTLSPKDKSATLQEQARRAPCSDSLLELRDWLKLQIEDEQKAFSQYNEAAAKMTHFRLPTWAIALHSMAGDEANHGGILDIIVDVITERCEGGLNE